LLNIKYKKNNNLSDIREKSKRKDRVRQSRRERESNARKEEKEVQPEKFREHDPTKNS